MAIVVCECCGRTKRRWHGVWLITADGIDLCPKCVKVLTEPAGHGEERTEEEGPA